MKKEKRLESKNTHNAMRDIQTRLAKGKPTTFAERNWLNMQLKKINKKRSKS